MDEITRFNQERWNALVAANVDWSRPLLDLNAESARKLVDPFNVMGDVVGKSVLCLASGGGQQSVAFGVLGAQVSVIDFSEAQLERDRIALAHYGFDARLVQGDMRDLSMFADASFDVVWHAFSVNFIPDIARSFDEVRRVMRPNGLYRLEWHNPFSTGIDEREWHNGYLVRQIYADAPIQHPNPNWDIHHPDGTVQEVEGPREFNHTLGTVINGVIGRGFTLLGLWEELSGDPNAAPGTWDHYKAVLPPWLTLWARYNG